MGLFRKNKPEDIKVLPLVRSSSEKKISVYDVKLQAYHEITLDEYTNQLKALGLSDGVVAAQVAKIKEG